MKDWLKLKKYTHFSAQFESGHIPFIRAYVSNPEKISKHRFHPFIHYTIQANRFKREKDISGQKSPTREKSNKKREIFYADHLDAQVFAYYGNIIGKKLEEEYVRNESLNQSVIAYRAIPFDKNRNKCNIDFANEVFQFVRDSKNEELAVLCFDIKSFFDTLDHNLLKKAWSKILGQKNLETDHYKVFKAITKFTYVELGDIINEFKEFNIKKVQYLKKKDIGAFCKSGEEFRRRVKNKRLINYNKFDFKNNKVRNYGIPQGSPISAVLSNLYLLCFDEEMSKRALEVCGLYRRYSDDILFICPVSVANDIKHFVYSYIRNELNLVIQEQKTQEVIFTRVKNNKLIKWECNTVENNVTKPAPLSYLGFDFDGNNIRIRQKGLSLYYRNLKRMIRRRARYAFYAKKYNIHNPDQKKDAWIYRQRIYKTKSHLGAKKKKVDGKVFWGNYISYVKTASKIMNQSALLKQIRNHWKIIERHINEFEAAYGLEKTPSKRKR